MTYLLFLILFVVIPLISAILLNIIFGKRSNLKENHGFQFSRRSELFLLIILAVIAVLYTTPWDNFLVANKIWFYDPSKVMGILLGYVPLEEYLFFIFQTLLIGAYFILLLKKPIFHSSSDFKSNHYVRVIPVILLSVIWFISLITYVQNTQTLIYLNLILLWAIPPISLQLLFGADILAKKIKIVTVSILSATFYLSFADALAIFDGIWTITSNTSTGIVLFGILPIEEFLFFLVTNILLINTLTLFFNQQSYFRIQRVIHKLKINKRTSTQLKTELSL